MGLIFEDFQNPFCCTYTGPVDIVVVNLVEIDCVVLSAYFHISYFHTSAYLRSYNITFMSLYSSVIVCPSEFGGCKMLTYCLFMCLLRLTVKCFLAQGSILFIIVVLNIKVLNRDTVYYTLNNSTTAIIIIPQIFSYPLFKDD